MALEYLSRKTLHQYQRRKSDRGPSPSSCIQYGQQSEAWQPLLIKDGEAVLPNKSDKFQRPIHRCRSLFPVMLKILRSEVD